MVSLKVTCELNRMRAARGRMFSPGMMAALLPLYTLLEPVRGPVTSPGVDHPVARAALGTPTLLRR
jgi:hypothetical protein